MSEHEEKYSLPQVAIYGGAGGEVARTEDLELAATTLEEAAREVGFAAGYVLQAEGYAERAIPQAIEGVRSRVIEAHAATYHARVAVGGFADLASELNDVAVRLTEVARHFEEAEAAAYQGVSTVTRVGRGIAGLLGMWSWTGLRASAAVLEFTIMNRLSELGGGRGMADMMRPDGPPPPITSVLNGASGDALAGVLDRRYGAFGNAYENVLWLLSRGTSFLERWAGEPRYVGVMPVEGTDAVPQSQGVADLVQNIDDTAQLAHGGITIDTITHPDGSKSHVINIPGTNDTSFDGESVRDWNSNFRLTDNNPSDAAQMVRDAIEAAGIGPDEPIMLQGHSQGGGVATQLAADLADDYTITHVVTYGSAPGRLPVMKDVEYLNVVTTPDLTPAGDARVPLDLPNVTTVELDLESAPNPQLGELADTITGAHSIEAYKAAGQATDASTEPSIEAWRTGAADFLGDGEVSRQQFEPTFEEPQAAPTLEPATPVGKPFGPPVPPPKPHAGQQLRDALIDDGDPLWSHLLEPDKHSPLDVLDWMDPSVGGVAPLRP